MTSEASSTKTYEECLKEIQELRASPNYGNFVGQGRPNSGTKLTREDFQMDDELLDGWANKFGQLFASSYTDSK
jgi:hypothetical protein